MYIHTIECYSAIKRIDILVYVTTWINIMLKERFQTQKATYYMILFILMSRIGKFIEKKVGPWRGGRKRSGKRRVKMVCFEKHLDLSQRGAGVSIGEKDEL